MKGNADCHIPNDKYRNNYDEIFRREKEEIPLLAVGNDELDNNEDVGETIICPHCNQEHPIKYGEEVLKDGTRVPSKLMAFYKCGDITYLAGINGKRI